MTDALNHTEYRDYRDVVGPDRQLWENNGWSVRGRDSSHDYLLWVSPYAIQGLPGQSYRPGQYCVNQTLLISQAPDAAPELGDNDFLAVGWDPDEYLPWNALDVTSTRTATSWALDGRRITAEPPHWSIEGSHAGVRTDLRVVGDSTPMWFTDPAHGLDQRADRWWIASGTVRGRIQSAELSVDVDHAHGVHERHIHCGLTHDPVALLVDGGLTWFTVSGERLAGYVMARPSRQKAWAHFTLDGREMESTDGAVHVRTERSWLDPATNMLVGQTWRIDVDVDDSRITLAMQATARAYYAWSFLSGGMTMLYWWLCRAEATVTRRSVPEPVGGLLAEAHLNRTFSARGRGRHG